MCLKFCEDYFGVHIFINMFPSSWKNTLSRMVESWHAYPYSTSRQVEMSFLGMPQIAHFQVEKWKSSLPWEGGIPLPHPPPARLLRSLAKIVPPKCFGSCLNRKVKSIIQIESTHFNPNQVWLFWLCYIVGDSTPPPPPRDLGRLSRDRDEILHTRRPGHSVHDCVVRSVKITNF